LAVLSNLCRIKQEQPTQPCAEALGGAAGDQPTHAVSDEHQKRPVWDGRVDQCDEVGGHVVDSQLLLSAAAAAEPDPVVRDEARLIGQQRND
jgi:hypothetical protein